MSEFDERFVKTLRDVNRKIRKREAKEEAERRKIARKRRLPTRRKAHARPDPLPTLSDDEPEQEPT